MKFDFSQIILNFSRLDIKIRYAALAFVVLIIFVLDFFILMRPQLGALSKMSQEAKQMKEDTDRVKLDASRMDQIRRGLDLVSQEMSELDHKVRSLQDIPYVMEDISRIASESGVMVDQITPSKQAQAQLAKAGNITYYTLPVTISVRSGYHAFGRFLNKLESNQLLFLVSDLKMDATEKPKILAIQMTLKVVLADLPSEAK